jgi:hypothetical protein
MMSQGASGIHNNDSNSLAMNMVPTPATESTQPFGQSLVSGYAGAPAEK